MNDRHDNSNSSVDADDLEQSCPDRRTVLKKTAGVTAIGAFAGIGTRGAEALFGQICSMKLLAPG